MHLINFPIKNLQGLDDNLAIGLVLNTAKYYTTTFVIEKRTLQKITNQKRGHYNFSNDQSRPYKIYS